MISKLDFYNIFSNEMPGGNLKCNDIYFEPINMNGLEEMHRYSTDPRLYEFFEFEVFSGISETKEYITKLMGRMAGELTTRTASYWFVRRSSDGFLIGTAGLVDLNYTRKSIEWGYGVDPALWGNGYVLKIQEALKKFVFEKLQLNRLHGITMVNNQRTIESVLASGMVHEGITREYYCQNGSYIDGWRYALISSDYREQSVSTPGQSKVTSTTEIIKVVASILDSDLVTIATSMENTPSWDSLNHMTIMVALREELGVTLLPSDIAEATSVKSLLELIKDKKLLQK